MLIILRLGLVYGVRRYFGVGTQGFYVTGTMVFRREGNECLNVVWGRLGLRHDITLLLGSLTHLVLSCTLLNNFFLQVWSWFENINKLLDAIQFYIIFDICVIVAICFYYDGFYYTNADYIMLQVVFMVYILIVLIVTLCVASGLLQADYFTARFQISR